jgi:hypothetical protein
MPRDEGLGGSVGCGLFILPEEVFKVPSCSIKEPFVQGEAEWRDLGSITEDSFTAVHSERPIENNL